MNPVLLPFAAAILMTVPSPRDLASLAAPRFEAVAGAIDTSVSLPGGGAAIVLPEDDTQWTIWRSEHKNVVKRNLGPPLAGLVDYVPTYMHGSFALNLYDTSGRLIFTHIAGSLRFTGPIDYTSPSMLATPVGVAENNFDWNRDAYRSPVQNLVADAMRDASGADIALMNFLGVRAGIPRDTVTREMIDRVLPFGNDLAVMEMSGGDIAAELDRSISAYHPFSVSGITRDDSGLFHLDGGLPLDSSTIYTVALPDYIAGGGGSYSSFVSFRRRKIRPVDLVDVTSAYITANSPIRPDTSSRLGPPPSPPAGFLPRSVEDEMGPAPLIPAALPEEP